jgi:hypothetical protein
MDARAFSQQAQEVQKNIVENIMPTEFWDRKGNLLTEFMAPGTTVTSEVYCEALNKVRRSIQNKWHRMLTKGIVLLHDNARRHTGLPQIF